MNNEIYASVSPKSIDMLTKLVEAYDHLGVVSTIDTSKGMVVVRVTSDTFDDMKQILLNMPFPIRLMQQTEINGLMKE